MNKIVVLFFFVASSASAESISFIGDSHSSVSYGLFRKLAKSLSDNGHTFTDGQAICGARIDSYISGGIRSGCNYPGITHMSLANGIASFSNGPGETLPISVLALRADAVLIQLGGNHIDSIPRVGPLAQNLAREILSRGKKCIWIGPAALRDTVKCRANRQKRERLSLAIAAALSDSAFLNEFSGNRCEFINSFELTKDSPSNSSDCRHYSDYAPWENKIRPKLLQILTERG